MTEQLALTSAQTGVWVAQQLNPDDRCFTFAEYCDIAGPVDPALFAETLREVAAATPALRARFDLGDEGLVQYIEDTVEIPFHHLDLSAEPDPLAAAHRWMTEHQRTTTYDLVKGPLATWALLRLTHRRHLWYRSLHHIVLDGFGYSLIASHAADVYTALASGRPLPPRPAGTLRQVVEADTAYQHSAAFRAAAEFWRTRLAGQTETVSLTDWRPAPTNESLRETARLGPADVTALRSLASRLDVRWPAVVVAAVGVQLHRATGVRRMAVGLPVAARTDTALRQIPAMVSNTVPLRLSLTPDLDFASLIRQAAAEVTTALQHQRYPLERLARDLPQLARNRRQFGPDINLMSFAYRNSYAGSPATVHTLNSGPVQDLTFNVYNRGMEEGMHLALDGNAALYTRRQLADHLDDFVTLLRSAPGLAEAGPIAP
ncbi:condensation domain-containing protein [Streptomyces sp. 769]|uniref:condensation domain-containing protein n=1 Tax=Streptomyces sp. 769 TaxID=1262452 RepID=UPI0005806133|nr:condensation domain-containing protein [Streptomyces sp. 769]AJC59858.1 siderophore 2 C3-dihydroxybenzoate-glycine-threonine trimeric ester bacillibactin synthetase [Streptomyces sp. 769]